MINRIKQFFEDNLGLNESADQNTTETVNLACAALLFEVMRADHHISNDELATLKTVLIEQLGCDSGKLDQLIRLAEEHSEQSTSFHQFTRLINNNYQYNQKLRLVTAMWKIAYADHVLDKYEENLVRRVSELLYVSHKDFIQAKLSVAPK